jgi:type IV secretion system protein VirD4
MFGKRKPDQGPPYYTGPPSQPLGDRNDVEALAGQTDAYVALRWSLSPTGVGGEPQRRRMPVGVYGGKRWVFTREETHLLALGPARSHAGKTASVMIPAILSAAGPVVAATTKPDVIPATALARAQMGNLLCFVPDGETPVPEGIKELHWSPLVGAKKWDVARRSASDMTRLLSSGEVRGGDHWKDRAAALLGPVFHWAALQDGRMENVLAAVHDMSAAGSIVQYLSSRSPVAAGVLSSVVHAGREEYANITSTAARALKVFEGTGALHTAAEANFDPDDFVRGGVAGRADTVYIVSTSRDQEQIAPLVVTLLSRIRDAVYNLHRERGGVPGIPTVFALDELYGLAPIPDLPSMLTDGGSQGLLIAGAVQDLTLMKSRWKSQGDAFLTLFGSVLVFPGIRDTHTLEEVSRLIGDHDRATVSESREQQSQGIGLGFEWATKSQQHSTHRERLLPPDRVYQGIDPENSDVLLWFHENAWDPVIATPWWRSDPWPNFLAACLARATSGRVPEWRLFEYLVTGEHPPVEDMLPYLPRPDLRAWFARWENDSNFPWRQREVRWLLHTGLPMLDQMRARPPAQARYELAPTWTMPGMPWTVAITRPVPPPEPVTPSAGPDFFASLTPEAQAAVRGAAAGPADPPPARRLTAEVVEELDRAPGRHVRPPPNFAATPGTPEEESELHARWVAGHFITAEEAARRAAAPPTAYMPIDPMAAFRRPGEAEPPEDPTKRWRELSPPPLKGWKRRDK